MRAQVSFSASAEIAERARLTEVRYMTTDGRYILTDKDLARLNLTPEEYVSGIDVILLTEEEAGRLIAEGGFKFGDGTGGVKATGQQVTEEATEPSAAAEPESEEESESSVEEEEDSSSSDSSEDETETE